MKKYVIILVAALSLSGTGCSKLIEGLYKADAGEVCQAQDECESGVCVGGICAAATCNDGVQNDGEEQVDCGGEMCPRCPEVKADLAITDGPAENPDRAGGDTGADGGVLPDLSGSGGDSAVSSDAAPTDLADAKDATVGDLADAKDADADAGEGGVATDGGNSDLAKPPVTDGPPPDLAKPDLTPVPSCMDQVKNGAETDVDCGGGMCPKCNDGDACKVSADCVSGVCFGGKWCAQPTCNDGVKNGKETDVDCGGGSCPQCTTGKGCKMSDDCTTSICTAGTCRQPTCNDGLQNQGESDVDCGGGKCPKCLWGKACTGDSDCVGGQCLNNACTHCGDGLKNGDETDKDCGGSCLKCSSGKSCSKDADCRVEWCNANKVCASIVGSFQVKDGPFDGAAPPPYNCVEYCAVKYGGSAAGYRCSTGDQIVNRLAFVDCKLNDEHCRIDKPIPVDETFKIVGNWNNCGNKDCVCSVWVKHSVACTILDNKNTNYCFK